MPNYEGLEDTEEKMEQILERCAVVLTQFEESNHKASYDVSEIISLIGNLKHILYSNGVETFVGAFGQPQEGALSQESVDLVAPIVKKWSAYLPMRVDEELHREFIADLHEFSESYPDHFNNMGTPITLEEIYKEHIWDKVYGRFEKSLNRYTDRFAKSISKLKSKYTYYVKTQFVTLSPYEFECLVEALFNAKGYASYVTMQSGDYGVDVIAENEVEKIAIQVKKYDLENKVGNRDIQQLLGAMHFKDYKATKAIFITTSGYTKAAFEQAEGNPIELWDFDRMCSEVMENLT